MDLEQQPTQPIPMPGKKDEVSKSETWSIPTLPFLLLETLKHWNSFALLGCALCSDKKDLEKVPHLGQQLEFCLSFGPQAKAGDLMASAPSAPGTASALSHSRMQDGKLGGNSSISSQNVTGVAPRGSN